MGWFRKRPHETVYAERIYEALAERELGDMTPEQLRLPKETHRRYREKALLYRESMSACALMVIANKDPGLKPVLREYKGILEAKRAARGLRPGRDVIDGAAEELEDMINDPFKWAHRWLMEFRDDPNDQTGVELFADHCLRQFEGARGGLDETRPKGDLQMASFGKKSDEGPGDKAVRRANELQRIAAEGFTESETLIALIFALGNEVAAMVTRHPDKSIDTLLETTSGGLRAQAYRRAGLALEADEGRDLTNEEFNKRTTEILNTATKNGILAHDAISATAKALGTLLTFEARRQGRTIDELVGAGQQMVAGFATASGTFMLENPDADPAKKK